VISPTTIDELSHFLKERKNAPLHITSGGEEQSGVETLSLSGFNRIITYEPEEMIVIAEAGITLHELQSVLKEKGQWIPTLVSEENPEATLGAAIARDHYHPRSRTMGMLRTTILGGTFCTPKGEVFKSGSRVVKSVAGYDIHRSFSGSQGLFGVIIHVTLKTAPLPEQLYYFETSISNKAKIHPYHPSITEEYNGKLFVELSGMKEDVSADIEDIRKSGIEHRVISVDDVQVIVKNIITSKVKKESETSSREYQLLTEVRRAFDAEGVLV
jgi:glycolate oxidase FAD binding subunit